MPAAFRFRFVWILPLVITVLASASSSAQDIALKPGSVSLSAPGPVSAVAVTYARHVACGTDTGKLAVWGPDTKPDSPQVADASSGRINAIAFSPDGLLIATAGNDGQVAVWNTKTLQRADHFASERGQKALAVDFSADSQAVAAGFANGVVKVWGLSDAQPFKTLEGHKKEVLAVGFKAGESDTLISIGRDKTKIEWKVSTGVQAHNENLYNDKEKKVEQVVYKAAAISRESKQIAIWGHGDNFTLNNIVDRNWIKLIDGKGDILESVDLGLTLVGGSNPNPLLAWSADGAVLAYTAQSESHTNTVMLFKNRDHIGDIALPSAARSLALAFRPEGYQLAVGDKSEVRLYTLAIQVEGIPTKALAVYDFTCEDKALAGVTADAVRAQVRGGKKFFLIDKHAFEEALDQKLQEQAGFTPMSAPINLVPMDRYIQGSVAKAGDHYLLTLSITDVKTGKEASLAADQPCSAEQLSEVAMATCRKLLKDQE